MAGPFRTPMQGGARSPEGSEEPATAGTGHEAPRIASGDTGHRATGGMSSGARTAVTPGTVPALIPWLSFVAAVTYASFTLEHLLSPKLDFIDGYASELSAIDQPYHLVYSAGDLITGVLAGIVAISCLIVLRRRAWAITGWVFLLLFGLSAIGDAVFPLDCAPSIDTRCALLERSGQVSFSHRFHVVTSSAVIVFGVLALFTLSMAARRYGWWPALAKWGWLLAVLEAMSGIVTLILMVVGHWLGFVQRIQISILCLALLVIAWALHADLRRRPSDPAEVELIRAAGADE